MSIHYLASKRSQWQCTPHPHPPTPTTPRPEQGTRTTWESHRDKPTNQHPTSQAPPPLSHTPALILSEGGLRKTNIWQQTQHLLPPWLNSHYESMGSTQSTSAMRRIYISVTCVFQLSTQVFCPDTPTVPTHNGCAKSSKG